jgi:hypothetical protein
VHPGAAPRLWIGAFLWGPLEARLSLGADLVTGGDYITTERTLLSPRTIRPQAELGLAYHFGLDDPAAIKSSRIESRPP